MRISGSNWQFMFRKRPGLRISEIFLENIWSLPLKFPNSVTAAFIHMFQTFQATHSVEHTRKYWQLLLIFARYENESFQKFFQHLALPPIIQSSICHHVQFNALSANRTKWSNTLKQFVGKSWWIVWLWPFCGVGA